MAHTESYKRKIALEWWRNLRIDERRYYSERWQDSLSPHSIAKNWSFEMMDASSSTIERIYEFITQDY